MFLRLIRFALKAAIAGALGGIVFFLCALSYVYQNFDGNAQLPSDCAIVFGTAVRPVRNIHGQIIYTGAGPGILRRVAAAAELYRAGQVKTVFLTGGKGEGMQESEASVMRRMAVVAGVRLEDTVIEERSTSTQENLEHTLPLMEQCASVVGVSDRYHLARIGILAETMGRRLTTYPAEAAPQPAFERRSAVREAGGIMLITLQRLLGLLSF